MKMDLNMMEISFKDYVMDLENIFGQMERSMKDNGSMITLKE